MVDGQEELVIGRYPGVKILLIPTLSERFTQKYLEDVKGLRERASFRVSLILWKPYYENWVDCFFGAEHFQ